MTSERGSDKLQHLKKAEISESQLDRLAGFANEEGIELVDWLVRGIPAVDWLEGSFHVRPNAVGDLINRLVAEGAVRQIVVFPYGIPAVDLVEVRFASGR